MLRHRRRVAGSRWTLARHGWRSCAACSGAVRAAPWACTRVEAQGAKAARHAPRTRERLHGCEAGSTPAPGRRHCSRPHRCTAGCQHLRARIGSKCWRIDCKTCVYRANALRCTTALGLLTGRLDTHPLMRWLSSAANHRCVIDSLGSLYWDSNQAIRPRITRR